MVDFTPDDGAKSNGDILLLGNTAGVTCGVVHADVANSTLGAIAVGGGVYDVKVVSNYAAWTKVYWDDANSTLTTTSANMSLFGFTVEEAAAANAIVKVLHQPHV